MLAALIAENKALVVAVLVGCLAAGLGTLDLETTARLGVERDWDLIVYGLGVLTGGGTPLAGKAMALRRALAGR